ncbi:MAG: hypothetical protein NC915_04595 [Candidatus Omnitrophica bacterium]|nr:hypothetical protein [Candidatus Omnitrophota bacterium]
MKKYLFVVFFLVQILTINLIYGEKNFIIEDFENKDGIKVATSRECDLELSSDFVISGKSSGKFIVFNKNIDPDHPPYFLIKASLTDWSQYNTLKFDLLVIPEKLVSSVKILIQLQSIDFDWRKYERDKYHNFYFSVPTGKPVEVYLPVDILKFRNNVGRILFCAIQEKGFYYVDKIELTEKKVEKVEVNEFTKEGINIPEFFSLNLKQEGSFWNIGIYYYNSEKPLYLEIQSNIPVDERKEKQISIFNEKNEMILSEKIVFEQGEQIKKIPLILKGSMNLKINIDNRVVDMELRDIEKLKKENLEIREKRRRTHNPFYRGIVSAYAGAIYKEDGSVNIDETLARIKDLGVNCYTYLIYQRSEKELESLPKFLEKAEKEGIEVWVYIVPPSEAPIGAKKPISEKKYPPYDMDYLKWAEKISEISLNYSNLTLWMIDDFDANLNFFTLEYTKKIYEKTKQINPKLLFGVCVYYDSIKNFVQKGYLPYFDAVLWGYQHSYIKFPECGLNATSLSVEINDYYKLCPDKILIPCIYFTPHSSWPKGRPTKEYLEQAIEIAYNESGICWVYTMPRPGTMQYEIVKKFMERVKLAK